MADAIGWLTVTIAVAIVAAQIAFLILLGDLRPRFPPIANASIANTRPLRPQPRVLLDSPISPAAFVRR